MIVFGLDESASSESKQKVEDDQTAMKKLLASIKCDNLEMKQLVKLAKNNNQLMKCVVKSRPLTIVLPDEQAKILILQQARTLRFMKHTKVFIVPDMTPTEQVQRKGLLEKKSKEKEWGRCGNLQGYDCHEKDEN